jgi:hypothetical protein
MEAFTYTPGGNENIDSFNMRLAKYSLDNNVVGVVSTLIGSTLILSLTLEQDLPAVILLRPFVAIVTEDSLPALETALSQVLGQIKAQDSDDVMSVPVEVRGITAPHAPTRQSGYALFLIAVGEVLIEEDDKGTPNGR